MEVDVSACSDIRANIGEASARFEEDCFIEVDSI